MAHNLCKISNTMINHTITRLPFWKGEIDVVLTKIRGKTNVSKAGALLIIHNCNTSITMPMARYKILKNLMLFHFVSVYKAIWKTWICLAYIFTHTLWRACDTKHLQNHWNIQSNCVWNTLTSRHHCDIVHKGIDRRVDIHSSWECCIQTLEDKYVFIQYKQFNISTLYNEILPPLGIDMVNMTHTSYI